MGTPQTRSAEHVEYRIVYGDASRPARKALDLNHLQHLLEVDAALAGLSGKLCPRSYYHAENYVGTWPRFDLRVQQRTVNFDTDPTTRGKWVAAVLPDRFDHKQQLLPEKVLSDLADAVIAGKVWTDADVMVTALLEVYGRRRTLELIPAPPPPEAS